MDTTGIGSPSGKMFLGLSNIGNPTKNVAGTVFCFDLLSLIYFNEISFSKENLLMIKRFNIPGLGLTAILTIPAPDAVSCRRITELKSISSDDIQTSFVTTYLGSILPVLIFIAFFIFGG
jgi:hypothetical protein